MSVRPSVRMKQLGPPTERIFIKFGILFIFQKSVEKIQFY